MDTSNTILLINVRVIQSLSYWTVLHFILQSFWPLTSQSLQKTLHRLTVWMIQDTYIFRQDVLKIQVLSFHYLFMNYGIGLNCFICFISGTFIALTVESRMVDYIFFKSSSVECIVNHTSSSSFNQLYVFKIRSLKETLLIKTVSSRYEVILRCRYMYYVNNVIELNEDT